jgi:dihydrofolate reductase
MKITLYMAISADGFIAGPNDETPWSDASWEAFGAFVESCNAVLLGRRTYEIMRDQDEFVEGPEYIVVTNDSSLDTGSLRKISVKIKTDLPQVAQLGVIGGGELNGSLAKLDAFDEILLDVEPIMLGSGMRLFGDHDVALDLELVDSARLTSGTLHNRYLVVHR